MNRKLLLIGGAASLALAAIWYMALWSPSQSALSAAHQRKAAADTKASDLTVKVRGLESAKKSLPALQAKLDTLRKAVPDTPALDQAIAAVNDAVNGSAVSLQSLAPAPIAAGVAGQQASGPFGEIRFTVSAQGSYFQVSDFIKRMSTSPRLIKVDSLNLTAEDKDGHQTVGIAGRMFTVAKPAPATPPTTAATASGGK